MLLIRSEKPRRSQAENPLNTLSENPGPALEYDETITVRTMRVEQFIGRKIKFFKLEAEGAEPEILDGLGDKISQIEYISADLGPERGKSRESTLVPVVNYMASQKFDLVQVSHDRICALFRNKDFK